MSEDEINKDGAAGAEDASEEADQEPSPENESPEETNESPEETDEGQETGLLQGDEEEEEEEEEFDLDAQIEVFRQQIEEDPENCVHHYNLGEALEELGNADAAKEEYETALVCDKEGEFSAIIHFGLGNLYFNQLLSGIQAIVVISSIGLHSAHKPGEQIVAVNSEDYLSPIREFEQALKDLPQLKADDELVEYISEEAPNQLVNAYYKWGSDLIDKSRQIKKYGDEIKDVKEALKHLKKTLDIEPNHSQAALMVKYAKKMLAQGWESYDEYGFLAKEIPGTG